MGMMAYHAKSIANAFITLANRDSCEIDPMQLQKLMYFANGYFVAENNGAPLIDEYFEAWDYGPVIPSVYYEFKEYQSGSIKRFAYTWDSGKRKRIIAPQPVGDEGAEDVISWVWETYKNHSGLKLSRLTHKTGGPWDKARKRAKLFGMRNEDISLEDTKEYFEQLIE